MLHIFKYKIDQYIKSTKKWRSAIFILEMYHFKEQIIAFLRTRKKNQSSELLKGVYVIDRYLFYNQGYVILHKN